MSDRLFTPAGPQVTPAESAQRRSTNRAAQGQLLDQADPAPSHCPACSSTAAEHNCAGDAQTLI